MYKLLHGQLDSSVDFLNKQCEGSTPLISASENGHLSTVQFLTEMGADKFAYKKTQLMPRNMDQVATDEQRCRPHTSKSQGETKLFSFDQKTQIAESSAACSGEGIINAQYTLKFNSVMMAAAKGHMDILMYLLKKSETLKPRHELSTAHNDSTNEGEWSICGNTPIPETCPERIAWSRYIFEPAIAACLHGQLEALKYILKLEKTYNRSGVLKLELGLNEKDNTVNLNSGDVKLCGGRSLMTATCEGGHLEIVEYLMKDIGCSPFYNGPFDFNSDVTVFDNLELPEPVEYININIAIRGGHFEVVRYLFDNGKIFSQDEGLPSLRGRGLPFIYASICGQMEVAKYIIEILMKNSKGIHPNAMFYYCCEHNQTELGKYLITEKGAKLHVTKEGLRGACFHSNLERVKIFIENGPSDLLQVPAPQKDN